MDNFFWTPHKSPFAGREFPASVHPLADIAPAAWLTERTRPMGRGSDRVLLWSIIPEGYPSYARLLHPAYVQGEDTPMRWAEIAARNSNTVHPLMQFGRLSGSDDPYACPSWADQPFVGQLPEAEAKSIVSVLRSFTTTPEQCYLLVWEGYGGIEQIYPASEKLVLPHRSYLAYTGLGEFTGSQGLTGTHVVAEGLWRDPHPGINYHLEIATTAKWKFTILQPELGQSKGTFPHRAGLSKGAIVIGPFRTGPRPVRAEIDHGGNGEFSLQFTSVDGTHQTEAFTAQAQFHIEDLETGLFPGKEYIACAAGNGPWEIKLSEGY